MRNELFLSVVMATYNGENYVKEQLESIFNQSLLPDEIIIIDDCSSDSTVNIIRKLISNCKIPCILIRNDYNIGVNASFFRGLSLSNGDLVFISDQDDVWLENKIEHMCKEWDGSDLICSDAMIVDEKLGLISNSELDYFGFDAELIGTCPLASLFGNNFSGHNMAVTREMICNMSHVKDSKLLYDWAFFIYANSRKSLQVINKVLCKHRFHSSNSVNFKKSVKTKIYIKSNISFIERKKRKIRDRASLLSDAIINLSKDLDDDSLDLLSCLEGHLCRLEKTIFNFSLFAKLYLLREKYFRNHSGYSRFRVIKNTCVGTKGYWIVLF